MVLKKKSGHFILEMCILFLFQLVSSAYDEFPDPYYMSSSPTNDESIIEQLGGVTLVCYYSVALVLFILALVINRSKMNRKYRAGLTCKCFYNYEEYIAIKRFYDMPEHSTCCTRIDYCCGGFCCVTPVETVTVYEDQYGNRSTERDSGCCCAALCSIVLFIFYLVIMIILLPIVLLWVVLCSFISREEDKELEDYLHELQIKRRGGNDSESEDNAKNEQI